MGRRFHLGLWFALLTVIVVGFFSSASAERFTGGSYIIDASVVGNSFGGDVSGGSYKLTSSGGESIIGQGSGGSYKLDSGYVAQLQNSIQLTVQPGGLKAYYPLEENSGTFTRDQSLYANNGTLQAGATWTTGKVGNALNGAAGYVNIPDNTQLPVGQHMTISAWVYDNALGTNQVVAAQWTLNTDTAWILQTSYTSSDRLVFFVSNAVNDIGSNYIATNAVWTASVWHHVVVVYDGTLSTATDRAKIYIDGVLQTVTMTGTIPSTLRDSGAPLQLSRMFDPGTGNRYFNGKIDEFKLFDRSFSSDEVKAEYDAGVAGNTAGLSFAGGVAAGVSSTSDYDAAILTDSVKGYTLAVNQNQNLTKGADTIGAVSGTIASPVTWVEGTTTGLGFTLYGTNATAIPGKWSSGAAYAAFPGTSTSYYTRTGKQSSKDVLNMRLRIGTTMLNVPGTYTNVVTTVGTVTP